MDIRLDDKVAVITGGSTGIGAATAIEYARAGAKVVFGDINEPDAKKTLNTIREEGGVAKFIERRGEGVHHIAFEVDDLQASLDALNEHGVRTIDNAPREGLSGMIGFIHPRSTRGVLIELVDQDTARR